MTSLAQHFEQSGIEKGFLQGIKTGKEEGREEGIEIGEARGVEKTALNMLKENLDTRLISQVTGMNAEEIAKLKNRL